MFKNQYKDFTVGQIEAALNLITDAGGIPALLRGDLEIRPKLLVFPKNEYGHYIIEMTGLNLTGVEEIARLEAAGFRIGDYAKSMLTSTNSDSYDANHRLEGGGTYKVVIVPGREVKKNRTTANLQAYGSQFGYGKPLAGLIPRIRESVTDKQMKEMGFDYIVGLHDPIMNSVGNPNVLGADRGDGGRWLDTFWDRPDGEWRGSGAFAFLVPN